MRIYVDRSGCLTVLGAPDPGEVGTGLTREKSEALAREILRLDKGELTSAEVVPAREALRELAEKLRPLGDIDDQIGAYAEVVWLDSFLAIRRPHVLRYVLDNMRDVVGFLDNWTDCARDKRETKAERRDRFDEAARTVFEHYRSPGFDPRERAGAAHDVIHALEVEGERLRTEDEPAREKEHEEWVENVLEPAQKAAGAALASLMALVAVLRERGPAEEN